MKKYINAILFLLIIVSCNDMKVGFLDAEYAVYKPNTMTVRKELDMDNRKDKERFEKKAHWVSPAIQGVQGTAPMFVTIHDVRTEGGGDVSKFLKYTTVRGNGQFDVDFENDIPVGKYFVTLKIENEGYNVILTDIFTIEIVQK